MAFKPRSSDGCWTCRLRRKKCDEARPVCEGCAALEIDCLYSAAKPDWMDNGARQKEMALLLKDKVKQRAAWRREKRFLQVIENGTAAINLTAGSDGEHIITTALREPLPPSATPSERFDPSSSAAATHMSRPSPDVITSNEDSGTDSSSEVVVSSVSASSVAQDVVMEGMSTPDRPSLEGYVLPTMAEDTIRHTPLPAAAGHNLEAAATAAAAAAPQPPPEWTPLVASLAPPNLDEERDMNLIMIYIDYVFPFLFPSYRPSLLTSGRGWLLMLVMKNKALFHSALSLSSYFFTIVVDNKVPVGQEGATSCRAHIDGELHRQQELSLQELQKSICELNQRGVRGHLRESARVLESIVQLIYFEVIISTPDTWCLHLDAALALFEQMMEHHGRFRIVAGENGKAEGEGQQYSWPQVLDQISAFRSQMVRDMAPLPVPFTSEQTALRFFTTTLLYMDIVSSSVFESPPRLQKFHRCLLRRPAGEEEEEEEEGEGGAVGSGAAVQPHAHSPFEDYPLSLEDMTGIQNWVLLGLSEVSALAAWKRAAVAEQRLSVLELVRRASAVEDELRARVADLETRVAANGWHGGLHGSHELFLFPPLQQQQQQPQQRPEGGGIPCPPRGFFSPYLTASAAAIQADARQHRHALLGHGDDATAGNAHISSLLHLSQDGISLIWGHATLTYLLVVVNGWQPQAEAIRQGVTRTLELMASLPSAACLRAVTWPFCVAGCLASRAQEPVFRGMVGRICGVDVFGSVKEALHIMDAVWAQRESIESGLVEWDMSKCLNILGRRPFLV